MKKAFVFLGTAAAALMLAGAAHAQSGYAGVAYGDGGNTNVDTWSVNGAAAVGSNFQIDAGYTSYNSSSDADAYNIGAHVFTRSGEWLWGGYVGYDQLSAGADVDEWTVAGQTQYYMDRTTLSGSLSYSQVQDFIFVGDVSTTALEGEARFFQTDNFSVNLNAGLGNVEYQDFNVDFDYWTVGGGIEWQLQSMPISVFADAHSFQSADASDNTKWQIGVRYNWGGTLLERNRSGASLSQPHGFLDALL
jgi:hypothetical protein